MSCSADAVWPLALRPAHAARGALRGRTVIDTTNDLTPGAPALNHLGALRSAGAVCHRAFSTVGREQLADPMVGDERANLPFTGPEARTWNG
jgi:hypothetical protein